MNHYNHILFNAITVFLFHCLINVPVYAADELPSVQQRIQAMQAARKQQKGGPKISAEDLQMMQQASEDLAKQMPSPGLKVGDKAPDFELVNAYGKPVRLSKQLARGPVILTFYRGAWCPFCNIELHALQESYPVFKQYQAQIIAVTPQLPDKSLAQVKKDKFPFEILSDLDNKVMQDYKLYFVVPQKLNELYQRKFGLRLEEYNGQGRLGLPVPATLVINRAGVITAVFADIDYKKRMEPADILAALKKL